MSRFQVHVALADLANHLGLSAELGFDGGALLCEGGADTRETFCFRLWARWVSVWRSRKQTWGSEERGLTSKFPRRVTGRRTMLGRDGLSTPSTCLLMLSSLSFPDMCNWFAAQLMLSRLACSDMSFCPARPSGGDLDMMPGAAGEWNPNPSGPRGLRLGCLRWRWRCWKLNKLLTTGEPGIQGAAAAAALLVGVPSFAT